MNSKTVADVANCIEPKKKKKKVRLTPSIAKLYCTTSNTSVLPWPSIHRTAILLHRACLYKEEKKLHQLRGQLKATQYRWP